jgi:hypothetical protein
VEVSDKFEEGGGTAEIKVVETDDEGHPVDQIIHMMFTNPDPDEALVYCNKVQARDGRIGALIVANERGMKAMMRALDKGGHPSLAESFRRSMASTQVAPKSSPMSGKLPKEVM